MESRSRHCSAWDPLGKVAQSKCKRIILSNSTAIPLHVFRGVEVTNDCSVYFFDIPGAFLCTPIMELVYAEIPLQYEELLKDGSRAMKREKTVYGL